MDDRSDGRAAWLSALCYTGISLAVAGVFLALAQLVGGYPPAAVYGGTVWTFLLTLIITMPVVAARFKRRAGGSG